MRFQPIYNKEFSNDIQEWLHDNGYSRLPDSTGGDRDFITIDIERKEYIWCENGFLPFDSFDELKKYEGNSSISLTELDKMRY